MNEKTPVHLNSENIKHDVIYLDLLKLDKAAMNMLPDVNSSWSNYAVVHVLANDCVTLKKPQHPFYRWAPVDSDTYPIFLCTAYQYSFVRISLPFSPYPKRPGEIQRYLQPPPNAWLLVGRQLLTVIHKYPVLNNINKQQHETNRQTL